jgi:hypothetical protein
VEQLGTIVRLQVQRASLKIGPRGQRRYDPSPIASVPALMVSPAGVIGVDADGARALDVHHSDHPESKNWGGDEISFGFTGHYGRMRALFGDHLTDGIAGENILIDTDTIVTLDRVSRGVVIETAHGTVLLKAIQVAEPCVEFTGFALRRPEENREVARALPSLRDGMRGFYACTDAPETMVCVGDAVYLLS